MGMRQLEVGWRCVPVQTALSRGELGGWAAEKEGNRGHDGRLLGATGNRGKGHR